MDSPDSKGLRLKISVSYESDRVVSDELFSNRGGCIMLELLRIIRSANLERSHTAFGIMPMDRSIGRKKVENSILGCVIFGLKTERDGYRSIGYV